MVRVWGSHTDSIAFDVAALIDVSVASGNVHMEFFFFFFIQKLEQQENLFSRKNRE